MKKILCKIGRALCGFIGCLAFLRMVSVPEDDNITFWYFIGTLLAAGIIRGAYEISEILTKKIGE